MMARNGNGFLLWLQNGMENGQINYSQYRVFHLLLCPKDKLSFWNGFIQYVPYPSVIRWWTLSRTVDVTFSLTWCFSWRELKRSSWTLGMTLGILKMTMQNVTWMTWRINQNRILANYTGQLSNTTCLFLCAISSWISTGHRIPPPWRTTLTTSPANSSCRWDEQILDF